MNDRTKYIGATDAAAILGISRWTTPLQLWMEKTGKVQPEDISNKLPVKVGIKVEQAVAELFEEETGKKVQRKNAMDIHKEYPFICCHRDRTVIGEDALLECKTASVRKAWEWEDDGIPGEYRIQAVHQLAVTGKARVYVACLIGNEQFVIRTVDRDEAEIKNLVAREVAFWTDYVLADVMPPEIKAMDGEALAALFNKPSPTPVMQLTPDIDKLVDRAEYLADQIKAEESQLDEIKNKIKAALGNWENGATGRWIVSWKPQSTTRLDSKALKADLPDVYAKYGKVSEIRVLRFKAAK